MSKRLDTRTVGLRYPCGMTFLPDGKHYAVTGHWENMFVFERGTHRLVRELCLSRCFSGTATYGGLSLRVPPFDWQRRPVTHAPVLPCRSTARFDPPRFPTHAAHTVTHIVQQIATDRSTISLSASLGVELRIVDLTSVRCGGLRLQFLVLEGLDDS